MSIALGAVEAGLAALWDKKPTVPDFHWTDLLQQQIDTTQGNLNVLPSAEKLGSQVNDFTRGERAKTLAGIPGLGDLETETVNNLKSWLRGELPSDVTSAVNRGANARAFAGGYGRTGMGRNLQARDLGLTSLDLSQRAVPLAQQYEQGEFVLRRTPEFNPASMFIDPMAAADFNARQNQQQWQRDWLANRIAAQPEAWQQSLMSSVNSIGSMADSIGGAYLGGMVGGLGGAGGGGVPPPPPPNTDVGGGSYTTGGYGVYTPPNVGYDYNPPVPFNPNQYMMA